MNAGTQRRLAAIMIADIAGFSRLMERDEALTFARLRRIREEVIRHEVEENGGRVIKTTGDGFLAEFSSATAAVRCGIGIQRAVISLESNRPDQDRIRFRIGINLGDIIVDGDDVAGDGVNIAARLEPLSPVDGLCIASAVHEQIRDNLDVDFEDIGEQRLKNISRPIRAFALNIGSCSAADKPFPAQRPVASSAAPRIRRLSIVVLPFTNVGGNPDDEYFVDGIAEDITTQLSRIKSSYVVGRNTAFAYKGKPIDLEALGRELGVRYVLKGRIERFEDGADTDVELCDSLTGAVIWSDTIAVDKSAVRNIRREVVTRMTVALNLQLISAEARRLQAENPDHPDAVDLVMQAWANYYPRTDALKAQQLFEKALAVQPDYQPALVGRARMLSQQAFASPGPDLARQIAEAERDAVSALALDWNDSYAHYTLSRIRQHQRRNEAALAEIDVALELNPNLVEAVGWKGLLLSANGFQPEALEYLKKAMTQSPRDPVRWAWCTWASIACTLMGNYREAAFWAEKSIAIFAHWSSFAWAVAAYTRLGDKDQAMAAKARLLELRPDFSIAFMVRARFSDNEIYVRQNHEYFLPALKDAGMPE